MNRCVGISCLLLLSLAPVLGQTSDGLVPHIAAAEELDMEGCVVDGFDYNGDVNDLLDLYLPDELGICSITYLGSYPKSHNNVRKLHLPNTVREIGKYAFTDIGIVDIEMNEGLVTIGDGAFMTCKLNSVRIPSSVKSIGAWTFWRVGMNEVSLPRNCSFIGDNAFAACGIESFIWPECDISNFLGFACNKISKLHVPSNIKSIGRRAFYFNNISELSFDEGVDSIGEAAFMSDGHDTYDHYLTIESLPYEVGASLFSDVVFPNSLSYIGNNAFENSPNLKTVKFGSGIRALAHKSFAYCPQIERIDMPDGLDSIGSCAFMGCYRLKSVVFSESVKTIGANAFWGCPLEGTVTLPGILKSVGDKAFSGLESPDGTKFVISEGIEEIGDSAFARSYITADRLNVKLPSTLRRIGAYAFWGCFLTETELPKKCDGNHDLTWDSYLDGELYEENVQTIGGMYRTGYSEAAKCEYVAHATCAYLQDNIPGLTNFDDEKYVYSLSGEMCLRFRGGFPIDCRLSSGFYVVVDRRTGESQKLIIAN